MEGGGRRSASDARRRSERRRPAGASGYGRRAADAARGPARRRRLSSFWTCNHCPYALAWHDRLVEVAGDYGPSRACAFFAVNSNDAERYPRDSLDAMRERVRARGVAVSLSPRREPGGGARLGRPGRRRTSSSSTPTAGSATRARPTPTICDPALRCRLAARRARRRARGRSARAPEHRARRVLDQVEALRLTDDRAQAPRPRPRVVGEPRPGLRRARRRDSTSSSSSRSPRRATFSVDAGRSRSRPTARTSACGRSRRCIRRTACGSRSAARSRSPAASARAPRRSSPG